MAKLLKLCAFLLAAVVVTSLPMMAEDQTPDPLLFPPESTPAPAPSETPAPEPPPAPAMTPPPAPAPAPESTIDTSTDTGKFQQAQVYEGQGKVNQALILYLQATAGMSANGYDVNLAAMAAYNAGNLFATLKNDHTRAAKLFHFAFALNHYKDSAYRAGEEYRALQNWAMACKLFRWGAVDSTDEGVKARCSSAFADSYAKFEQSQNAGGK